MKKGLREFFADPANWAELFAIYAAAALLMLIGSEWYILAIYAAVCLAVWLYLGARGRPASIHDFAALRRAMKKAAGSGDAMRVYRLLDEELLPELRGRMPKRLYKYFYLGDDRARSARNLDTVGLGRLWSSVPGGFNDPFECRYTYLTEKELDELGFPPGSKALWDRVMDTVRRHITAVCFTQNPNDMPMWAYYANEHRGFCVEYEVESAEHLYPVFYAKERLAAQALFINALNSFFNPAAPEADIGLTLRHMMLLSAFKDESWRSENEIRAIFLNSSKDMGPKGRAVGCAEAGLRPVKLYIGVNCAPDDEKALEGMAAALGVACEKCSLSEDSFSVLK